jgi:DNA-binding transcriptional MerR regulator
MEVTTRETQTYTIQEVSKLSGLAQSTLRYYETIGIIRPIARDANSKHRAYSQEDVDGIDAIACLNAVGMSIDDMRMYLKNRDKGTKGAAEEMRLLGAQRQRLQNEAKRLRLRQTYIEQKIAYWQAVTVGNVSKAEEIAARARSTAKDLRIQSEA